MDEKTKSTEPTPEQLLKMLDLQIAASRQRRTSDDSGKRNTTRFLLLGVILLAAGIALYVLLYLLEEMRPPKDGAKTDTEETAVEIAP